MSDKIQFKSAKLAVLIDADNASSDLIEPVLKEIEKHGNASVKRIYGDWSKPQLSGWKAKIAELALRPIHQSSNGKNSTDIALVIDAMDLLYTEKIDGFCIVSSDSDYTSLAIRIRESGQCVLGFGEVKTKNTFVRACNRFFYIESLRPLDNVVVVDFKPDSQTENQPAQNFSNKQPAANSGAKSFSGLTKLFKAAFEGAVEKNGWANLGAFGQVLKKTCPSFDAKEYGHNKLTSLVQAIGMFEVQTTSKGTQIKLKQSKQKA